MAIEEMTTSASSRAAAPPTDALPLDIAGLETVLTPNAATVQLMPPDAPLTPSVVYHQRRPADNDALVLHCSSQLDEIKLVRISVECVMPHWNPHWPRWTIIPRRTPELLGGEAVDAQDVVSADGTTLTLLLLPHESREVWLRFDAVLDGETIPDHYYFLVVIADITSGTVDALQLLTGTLTLDHPESRFLRMLPTIFREAVEDPNEPRAAGQLTPFFARFLRGFEDGWEPLQALITLLPDLVDPRKTPGDFLPWLSSWIGIVTDENWPEMKRRRLLTEAVELYRWRGTRRGLARYLEIYTGVAPDINDQPFEGMRLGPQTLLGRDTILGDVAPHTFIVTLAVADPAAINEQIVRDIIDSERPAHTGYTLRIVTRTALDEERTVI